MNNGTKELAGKIRQFVLKQFPVARRRLRLDDDTPLDSSIVDSMGVLDLVLFVEDEFGITISEEELLPENFETIGSLAKLVETKLNSY